MLAKVSWRLTTSPVEASVTPHWAFLFYEAELLNGFLWVHVQIVSAQIVSVQFVSAQIVSAQIVSGTNCIGTASE
jgi:hypothetical protein